MEWTAKIALVLEKNIYIYVGHSKIFVQKRFLTVQHLQRDLFIMFGARNFSTLMKEKLIILINKKFNIFPAFNKNIYVVLLEWK